jgi:hypothetical protein
MNTQKCSKCEKPATARCANCSSTYYCDQQCQRAHWSTHKVECNKIHKSVSDFSKIGEALVGSIADNKIKFINILQTTYSRYRYITSGGNDTEIIDQFDKAILSRKNDEEYYELDLIRPIMAKYSRPSSKEEFLIFVKIIKEFDEGKRTFNDPHFFSEV